MKIVITGGTGFIGLPLVEALLQKGHDLTVLTRDPSKGSLKNVQYEAWSLDNIDGPKLASLMNGKDAVVHLSGEPLAAGRWTEKRKREIMFSRINSTRAIVDAISSAEVPPKVLVSTSAVGYYGPRGDEIADEEGSHGDDFLSRVCVAWENEANKAKSPNTRVVVLRLGIVLGKGGGALERLARPIESGLGGKLGTGMQWMPWIHRDDVVNMILFVLENEKAEGVFNATAPNPVTNEAFTNVLGRVLKKTPRLTIPSFILRVVFGREFADLVLLSGQKALPERALNMGFEFKYADLEKALLDIFEK